MLIGPCPADTADRTTPNARPYTALRCCCAQNHITLPSLARRRKYLMIWVPYIALPGASLMQSNGSGHALNRLGWIRYASASFSVQTSSGVRNASLTRSAWKRPCLAVPSVTQRCLFCHFFSPVRERCRSILSFQYHSGTPVIGYF